MGNTELHNEKELLSRISKGDENAFVWLYEYYQPKLHLFLFPLTGFSRADTEEVIQDIFIKIWLRKETLPGINSIQAYLFTMAKNRLSDIRTRRKEHLLQHLQPGSHTDVEEKIQLDEYHAVARIAIDRLPPQKRRVFLLRNEDGLSLDEIAEKLDITKFAVKKQLYEAIKSIKDYLKNNADLNIPILVLIYIYL